MKTSRTDTARWLMLIVLLGLLFRIAAWWFKGGFHYPDEIFQQLEPAHHLRTGVGWLPWEFGRGLRSWIMPWFYAGLMETLSWVGVLGHDALRAVNLHNALWSAAMIPAAFRMGRALASPESEDVDRCGLLAAALIAACPPLLYYAPHALMGSPSMICLTWGWAFWLEARHQGEDEGRALMWMGFWFGLAGMIRFTSGLHMLLPLLDLLIRRRFRPGVWLFVGALPGVLLLGIVDWATWGKPFHSAIEHFTYNYLEGGASDHGVSPWHFYFTEAFLARLGLSLIPLALIVLGTLKRTWPVVLTLAIPTALLSTVAHKEARFLMHNWPLLMVALGVGLVTLQARLPERLRQAGPAITISLALTILALNLHGTSKADWRWRAGIFQAQGYVGAQPDATGLLFDDRQHLNGGYITLGRTIPQLQATPRRLENPLFNYAALLEKSPIETLARRQGWQPLLSIEGVTVLRKPPVDTDAQGLKGKALQK